MSQDQTPASPAPAHSATEKFVHFTVPSTKRQFVLRVPTESIIGQAIELAHPHSKSGPMREMSAAQGYQLRLCLVSVDGRTVRQDEVQGDDLHNVIDIKEYALLIKALETLTNPPKEDVEGFLESMRSVSI